MKKTPLYSEGNTLGILRRSFFPFNAFGMPSFNNSVRSAPQDDLCHQKMCKNLAKNVEMSRFNFHGFMMISECLCYRNISKNLLILKVVTFMKSVWPYKYSKKV